MELDTLMLDHIDGLSEQGLSWTLQLQGVNDGSVKVVLKNGVAQIHDQCDLSGEDYLRDVKIDQFDARFSTQVEDKDEYVYDEVFPLDGHSETINIYDFLVQSIKLQEPIIHIKPGKEYLLDEYGGDDDTNDEDNDEVGGQVIFH